MSNALLRLFAVLAALPILTACNLDYGSATTSSNKSGLDSQIAAQTPAPAPAPAPTTTTTPTAAKPAPTPAPAPVVNNNTALRSSGGVLTIPASLNARVVRAQVVHTRNGYLPAFDVSGAKGVGVANGFQWINFGKNPSGIYNAGKPLSAFPSGKLGGAVWLVSGDRSPPFASDGNLVVTE